MAENIILQHPRLTILQQINELKKWYNQEQLKLGSQTKLAEDNVLETKNVQISSKGVTDKQSGKYPHNPDSQLPFDEIPIKASNHNVNEILENNMMEKETLVNENQQNKNKAKFRFLRKGEGIARFRMGPRKIQKSINKDKRTLNLSSGIKKPDDKHVENCGVNNKTSMRENLNPPKNEIPTLDPPDLKLIHKDWKSVFNNKQAEQAIEEFVNNNKLQLFQPNSSLDSSTASIEEKLLTIYKKLKERKELHVFEMMEQHVLDSSFSSSSSYTQNMMKNAVISTPVKMSLLNRNTLGTCNRRDQITSVSAAETNQEDVSDKCFKVLEQEPPMWIKPENSKITDDKLKHTDNEADLEQSLHVRFAEKVGYKSPEYFQSFDNSTLNESSNVNQNGANGEKVFDDSGEWGEYSADKSSCSCSTTYSSSDEDVKAISPPAKPPLVQSHRVPSKSQIGEQNKNGTQDTQHTITSNGDIDVLPPTLASKLKELKEEIDIFRAENNKLKTIRQELEKERKLFQAEKKKYIKHMEEERKKNADYLEEEKQKLAKQKLVFEKYSKSLTKNPTKEERKEIQALREQLSEMKEELNKKESRWGAAQARVRNQVKHLEEDNKKLRDELDVLRKQSRHLEFLTKNKIGKRLNNTQRIHAINEIISNIPIEDHNEALNVLAETGYFGPSSKTVETVAVDEIDPRSINTKVVREKVPKTMPPPDESNKKLTDHLNKQVVIEPVIDNNTSPSTNDIEFISENDKNKMNIEQYFSYGDSSKGKSSKGIGNDSPPSCIREMTDEDGNVEKRHPDGKIEIRYKNGNIKKIDPLIGLERVIYFNGDVEEILRDGTVKYYFAESRIWHIKLSDESEIFEFPNGQVEKRLANGTFEISYPNNCKKINHPDGSVEIYYADGVVERITPSKDRVISFPNGQKEIHTGECIRREYPDGSVKKVFPDGATETVFSNGRVRLKDKHGNLVKDSGEL